MSLSSTLFPLLQRLRFYRPSSFSLEISIALMIKFFLLGVLWWTLVAGQKTPVDENVIADKIFNENKTAGLAHTRREKS